MGRRSWFSSLFRKKRSLSDVYIFKSLIGKSLIGNSFVGRSCEIGPLRLVTSLLAGIALAGTLGCGNFASQGRNAQGVRLFQQAQYQAALRQFQEATYTDPDDPDGYYNLAATYHQLGVVENRQTDLDQAETYYNMCLDKNEDHRDCYRGLAVLLAQQGRNEESFRLLEGWTQRQPGSADAKIELARLNQEFGYRSEAAENLAEALAVDPNNSRALAAMGRIREETGNHAEALRNYQRSLAYDRFQPQVASRITALRSTIRTTAPATAPAGGTRLVDQGSTGWKSTNLQ